MYWSFLLVFGLCECSERVTSYFDHIDLYIQCDWYTFPWCIRCSMTVIIHNTQESVILPVYGKIACNREAFKRVRCFFVC